MAVPPAWADAVHHDSAALYVSRPLPRLGETVQVSLRTPVDSPITAVGIRTVPDGEPRFVPMQRERQDSLSVWWVGEFQVSMPHFNYRFRLTTPDGTYNYNQLGVYRADLPDHYDFRLLADFTAPAWVRDAVFYQIFPDRFYNGDPSNDIPPGAWTIGSHTTQRRAWGAPVLHYREGGNLDFYGGDLPGIIEKLPYLHDLGVTALYLNPIFAARTNHRYDITDFEQIDPYLGGNAALAKLREALDSYGMKVILDVTLNHVGWFHRWFTAAQADPRAETAEYFTFYEHPHNYESWLGHPSLPKLNYRSQKLRDRAYRQPDSVLRRWLRPPYRIDGWRLDVFNMQGRQGAQQLGAEINREMRAAVKADNPNVYLMGEHFFDATPNLQGDQVDAVMNYQGFTFPVWRWLGNMMHDAHIPGKDLVPIPAEVMVEQWAHHRAAIPYAIALMQYNLLCSHDTVRFLSLVDGSIPKMKVGAALLLTYPGVPSLYYGDEIGLAGERDPDNRRCMPWDENQWDQGLRAHYQRLIQLRRAAPALREGGFQVLHAAGDVVCYQRMTNDQRVVVIAWRAALPQTAIPVAAGGIPNGHAFREALSGAGYTVHEGRIALPAQTTPGAVVLVG